jgi:predicted RNase H-like HicB family nuclease
MKLRVVIRREEDGRYSVALPAFPGCDSVGDSLEEARTNILEAAEGWLDANNIRNPFEGCRPAAEEMEEVEL